MGTITIVTLTILFVFAMVKRINTPIIEIDNESIVINDFMRPSVTVYWSTVTGLKKSWLLGYKLEGIGGGTWIPVYMLNTKDREKLIAIVNTHINART